jgi:hypothetical protein
LREQFCNDWNATIWVGTFGPVGQCQGGISQSCQFDFLLRLLI